MDAARKALLRKRLQTYRDRIPVATRDAFSRVIMEQVALTVDWESIRRLHCYIPITSKHEVDTWRLLRYVWKTWPNVEVSVPGPLYADSPIAYVIDGDTKWTNTSIMPRPLGLKSTRDVPFDLVIVPCLGFDKHRYRLGYGAGYYDRLLHDQADAVKLGVAFQASFAAGGLPHERHDVVLDRIITEQVTL